MRLLPLIALMALIGCNQQLTSAFKGGLFGGKAAQTQPVQTAAPVVAAVPSAQGLGVAPIQTQTLAPMSGAQVGKKPAIEGGVGKTIPNAVPVAKPVSEVKPTTDVKPSPAVELLPEVKPILPPSSPEEAACRKLRGTWGAVGKSGAKTCFHPSKDAGKSCSKQSDCSSQCLARSKTCAPFWPIFGCTEILQKDGSQVKLCLD